MDEMSYRIHTKLYSILITGIIGIIRRLLFVFFRCTSSIRFFAVRSKFTTIDVSVSASSSLIKQFSQSLIYVLR